MEAVTETADRGVDDIEKITRSSAGFIPTNSPEEPPEEPPVEPPVDSGLRIFDLDTGLEVWKFIITNDPDFTLN
jgi:hypothetical protein